MISAGGCILYQGSNTKPLPGHACRNMSYLRHMLPLVDRSLEWCASRYDTDGLFLCNAVASKGKEGSDCGGPGMDWVDWAESRASGKTFNFELWHAFTLKRIAALHFEFERERVPELEKDSLNS